MNSAEISTPPNFVVECQNLSKDWENLRAVDNVTLRIPKGAVVALVGPNGAGKSTWMKMIAGLLEPTSGQAKICGIDIIRDPRSVHRFVGFLPDFFGLYENMTVEEYLSYFCRCYGITGAKINERVDQLLEVVSLSHKKKEVLDHLSRGMKQRIAIARSLVSDPPLLILDEPAAGLDPEARSELQKLFQKLAADGKTLIVSSHILSELQEYSTHVAILQRGTLMAWGPTRELATAGDTEESHRIRIRLLNESADYSSKLSRLDARLTALESTPASLLFRFQGKLSEVPAFIKKLSNEDLPLLSVGIEEEDMQAVYLKYMKGSQND